MPIDINSLIANATSDVVVLAVVAWLIRKILELFLAKDRARFESNLSSESTKILERSKHEFQIMAQEHQIVLSKLHEKRAEVVAELYEKLVETYWASLQFTSPSRPDESPINNEMYDAAVNHAVELYKYFEKNKIYFPNSLCEEIDGFIDGMEKRVRSLGFSIKHAESQITYKTVRDKHIEWNKAWEFFNAEAPKSRARIEAEFRSIIGIT